MCDDGLVTEGLDPVDALGCTAFMIGSDTFATAGHCIVPDEFGASLAERRTECHERKVILRWRESDDSSFPLGNPNILDRHVYQCVEVLAHGGTRYGSKEAGNPNDWAEFRVDRLVSGGVGTGGPLTPAREPLTLSTTGVTTGQTDLLTIGHAYSRPLRIDTEVTVAMASSPQTAGTFEIQAEGAPGLSGAPVLDASGAVVRQSLPLVIFRVWRICRSALSRRSWLLTGRPFTRWGRSRKRGYRLLLWPLRFTADSKKAHGTGM